MPPFIDPTANAATFIDVFHQRIYEGTAWGWSHRYEDVANNGVIDTVFQVFGGAHLVGRLEAGGAARVDFVKVSSYTDGTSLGPVNHNGFKSHVASMIVHHTASINVLGANIVETLAGEAGTSGKAAGGETGGFPEFLLPTGIYGIRFTNVSGGAADFALQLHWYNPGNDGG